jgi:hypothetical protein
MKKSIKKFLAGATTAVVALAGVAFAGTALAAGEPVYTAELVDKSISITGQAIEIEVELEIYDADGEPAGADESISASQLASVLTYSINGGASSPVLASSIPSIVVDNSSSPGRVNVTFIGGILSDLPGDGPWVVSVNWEELTVAGKYVLKAVPDLLQFEITKDSNGSFDTDWYMSPPAIEEPTTPPAKDLSPSDTGVF